MAEYMVVSHDDGADVWNPNAVTARRDLATGDLLVFSKNDWRTIETSETEVGYVESIVIAHHEEMRRNAHPLKSYSRVYWNTVEGKKEVPDSWWQQDWVFDYRAKA